MPVDNLEVIVAPEGLTPEVLILDPAIQPEVANNAAEFDFIQLLFPGLPGPPGGLYSLVAPNQLEAEAGVSTELRAWTSQRVRQSTDAWWLQATTPYGRGLTGLIDASAVRTAIGLGGAAVLNVGNTTGTVTAGDDSRLSDARVPTAHNQAWSTITTTPTTLAGYGITDAQGLDTDLTAIASLTTTAFGRSFLDRVDATAGRTLLSLGGASILNVGTTVNTVAAGDDSRITKAFQVVTHGSVAATPRPVGAIAVYWVGLVEPTNALNGDLWNDTTPV